MEHLRLLHAGPTLVFSSLSHAFHILRAVWSVSHGCTVCHCHSIELGQLPPEQVAPGTVVEKVGGDYAGPLQIKYGMARKPVMVNPYIFIFVSLTGPFRRSYEWDNDFARRGSPTLTGVITGLSLSLSIVNDVQVLIAIGTLSLTYAGVLA